MSASLCFMVILLIITYTITIILLVFGSTDLNYELFIMIGAAFSGLFGMIGAVIIAWLNRDKTKADATAAFAATITELVGNVSAFSKMLREEKAITDKRDGRIDDLERDARQRHARIEGLIATIAEKDGVIETFKIDLARVVESGLEKDAKIKSLEEKNERWRIGWDKDRERITTLETERAELVRTVEKLRKKLEDNGSEIVTKNGENEDESATKTQIVTEIDKTETEQ